jgi:cytochrome c oxidase subunit III
VSAGYTDMLDTLPTDVSGGRAPGWWGIALFVATEAMLFASLLFGYFYVRSGAGAWPPAGIERPALLLPSSMTVLLAASSVPMYWAERSIRRGHQGRLVLGLALSFLLGAGFLVLQGIDYSRKEFTLQTNAYGSLFFAVTGLHAVHVLVGLLMNAVVQLRTWLGHFDARRHLAVQNTALYWHFVNGVAIVIFASLYLVPYLG